MSLKGSLIEASNRQREKLERRSSNRRRVRKDRRKGVHRSVGMDISPSGIAFAMVETTGQSRELIVDYVYFPEQGGPRHGQWNDGVLKEAVTGLAAKYHLGGQGLMVSIGGEPCVTRVVAGDNAFVDNEIHELTSRTERYIGMGAGSKLSCQSTTPIDARRKRAFITIAMRDVVDAIAEAVTEGGMRLAHMEHTMIVLCRVLAACGADQDEPVLFVVDESGRVDVGISYQGRLMLDYRPAMPYMEGTQEAIVQRHLKCLKRYIFSQLPGVNVEISKIFMSGTEAESVGEFQGNDNETVLERQCFPLEKISRGLPTKGYLTDDPGMVAAVGLAMSDISEVAKSEEGDLVSMLQSGKGIHWISLAKQSWPIALAASIAVVLFLMGNHSHRAAAAIEQQVDSLSTQHFEARRIRHTLQRAMRLQHETDKMVAQLSQPRWSDVIIAAGRNLPDETWLDSIHIEGDSAVRIHCGSKSPNAVYAFIDRMRQCGKFTRVSLESTEASRDGAEYRFEVSAKYESPAETTSSLKLARRHVRRSDHG